MVEIDDITIVMAEDHKLHAVITFVYDNGNKIGMTSRQISRNGYIFFGNRAINLQYELIDYRISHIGERID